MRDWKGARGNLLGDGNLGRGDSGEYNSKTHHTQQ